MSGRKPIPKSDKIKKKHQLFVQEYMINGNNAAQAYMKVFKKDKSDNVYCARAAHQLLLTQYCQDLIQKERDDMDIQYQVNKGLLVKELLDTINACKVEEDRTNLLKSIDILNKMSGNYTEKREVNVSGQGIVFNFHDPNKDDNNLIT